MLPAPPRLTIAGRTLESPFILAPLAGYTDYAFRALARRFGAGLTFTEMVSATALARSIKKTFSYLRKKEGEDPVGVQIFGGKVEDFKVAVSGHDFSPFAFIDINMGCPVRKVIKSGGGSALLTDTNKMETLIRTVREHSDIPVTGKIRLGVSRGTPGGERERAQAVESGGAAFITVHGRYTSDKFQNTVLWEEIGKIKDALAIPVFGNGDILSREDAERAFNVSGVDGIMIGRGAVGTPWLFAELNSLFGCAYTPPPHSEILGIMREHYADSCAIYGQAKAIHFMRKFFMRYLKHFPLTRARKIEVMRCETTEELEAYFTSIAHECGVIQG